MPRRIPDFPDQFHFLNSMSSLGSYISAASLIVFFYMLYVSFTSKPSPNNN